jgi:hypothetical protein
MVESLTFVPEEQKQYPYIDEDQDRFAVDGLWVFLWLSI